MFRVIFLLKSIGNYGKIKKKTDELVKIDYHRVMRYKLEIGGCEYEKI